MTTIIVHHITALPHLFCPSSMWRGSTTLLSLWGATITRHRQLGTPDVCANDHCKGSNNMNVWEARSFNIRILFTLLITCYAIDIIRVKVTIHTCMYGHDENVTSRKGKVFCLHLQTKQKHVYCFNLSSILYWIYHFFMTFILGKFNMFFLNL